MTILINSERSLQASFWARLNRTFPAATRRMFIEPRLELTKRRRRIVMIPDIVICNTNHVIGVVEIKYQPRGTPSYDKDMRTLRTIAANRKPIYVTNDRFRGPVTDAKEYSFSKDVLFVWAGIHKAPEISFQSSDVPLLSHGIKKLAGCFLQLHAETQPFRKPKVFSRFG